MTGNKFLLGLVITAIILVSVPASAASGEYTLGIFGNANEDDTIDLKDVEYTASLVLGLGDQTQLADSKYDDKINMLDVTQIELIMLGREKKLTLLDYADRIVTINKPVERVVCADLLDGITTLVQLGAEDKIVAITEGTKKNGYGQLINPESGSWWTPLQSAAPELKDLPMVGTWQDPNLEMLVSLKPDVVFVYCARGMDTLGTIQDKTGAPIICLSSLTGSNFANFDDSLEIYRLAGGIVGKEKEAEELISYADIKMKEITEITSDIPDREKPRVYMVGWMVYLTKTPRYYGPINMAGGINVAEGSGTGFLMADVSKEQIIAWNPDIILIHRVPTSKSHVWGNSVEDVLTDLDLQSINAVMNKRVYYTKGFCAGWDPASGIAETFYLAKLFHPDEFEDLDVEEEGNGILEKFYGVDSLYTEMADRCELYRWE
ncbi:MAG TPA: hypothetical protein C5S50_03135 [Methanosarcinaceae archaeon]|nr:hypothetical protein [Methanosarcinaceae archaeon]